MESEQSIDEETQKLGEQIEERHVEAAEGKQRSLEDLSVREKGIRAEKVLRLLTVAAILEAGRGDDLEKPSEESAKAFSFELFMEIYTIAVVAISVLFAWTWLKGGQSHALDVRLRHRQQTHEKPAVEDALEGESDTNEVLREDVSGRGSNEGGSAPAEPRGGGDMELEQRSSASNEAQPLWRGEPRPRWRGEIEIRGRNI